MADKVKHRVSNVNVRSHFTEPEINEVRVLAESGLSDEEIAEKTGRTMGAIYNLRQRRRIPGRKYKIRERTNDFSVRIPVTGHVIKDIVYEDVATKAEARRLQLPVERR